MDRNNNRIAVTQSQGRTSHAGGGAQHAPQGNSGPDRVGVAMLVLATVVALLLSVQLARAADAQPLAASQVMEN